MAKLKNSSLRAFKQRGEPAPTLFSLLNTMQTSLGARWHYIDPPS